MNCIEKRLQLHDVLQSKLFNDTLYRTADNLISTLRRTKEERAWERSDRMWMEVEKSLSFVGDENEISGQRPILSVLSGIFVQLGLTERFSLSFSRAGH